MQLVRTLLGTLPDGILVGFFVLHSSIERNDVNFTSCICPCEATCVAWRIISAPFATRTLDFGIATGRSQRMSLKWTFEVACCCISSNMLFILSPSGGALTVPFQPRGRINSSTISKRAKSVSSLKIVSKSFINCRIRKLKAAGRTFAAVNVTGQRLVDRMRRSQLICSSMYARSRNRTLSNGATGHPITAGMCVTLVLMSSLPSGSNVPTGKRINGQRQRSVMSSYAFMASCTSWMKIGNWWLKI